MTKELIEYRVRPVTRYIVTRFEMTADGGGNVGGGSAGGGEFDNYETAYAVAYALAKADHERKGWPIGDERIQYPRREEGGATAHVAAENYRNGIGGLKAGAQAI